MKNEGAVARALPVVILVTTIALVTALVIAFGYRIYLRLRPPSEAPCTDINVSPAPPNAIAPLSQPEPVTPVNFDNLHNLTPSDTWVVPESTIVDIEITSDDSVAVVGFMVGRLGIWNLETNERRLLDARVRGGVRSLAISPDDRWLAVGTNSNLVWLYDLETMEAIGQWETKPDEYHNITGTLVEFQSTGVLLAAVQDEVKACDLATGAVRNLWYEASGLLAWRFDHPTIRTIDYNSASNLITYGREGDLDSACCPDIGILSYESSVFSRIIRQAQAPINAVALSPDGRYIVAGGEESVIRIVDTDSLDVTTISSTNPTLSLVVHPGDQLAISGNEPQSATTPGLILWDVTNHVRIADYLPGEQINVLSMSNSGEFFISASEDGIMTLWRLYSPP